MLFVTVEHKAFFNLLWLSQLQVVCMTCLGKLLSISPVTTWKGYSLEIAHIQGSEFGSVLAIEAEHAGTL